MWREGQPTEVRIMFLIARESIYYLIRVKEEQDRKFKEMVELETIKADIEAIAKDEQDKKTKDSEILKVQNNEKKTKLVSELTDEPKEGVIISIAFRLPNGIRVTRNFRQDEPVKVD